MSRPIKRQMVNLSIDEKKELERISAMRTEEKCRVERAKILLRSASGTSDTAIAREMAINRSVVNRCVTKFIKMGMSAALNDLPRTGAKPVITNEEKGWVVFLACEKPTEFGYPNELWTISLLLGHIRKHSAEKGYERLAGLSRSKLWAILNGAEIQPYKIRYYLEKRDPDFEEKMNMVLLVYKEVERANEMLKANDGFEINEVTVSYDEKPGIQVLEGKAPDLPNEPFLHSAVGRDYEYIRHGTISLLAGIDLHDGTICANISKTHKSSDFINFLKKLDCKYSGKQKIKVILDNHSAHTSKETRAFLETKPNRFEFIFTPKHGSWLNIIEAFFSKMARTMLREVRAKTDGELIARIQNYIDEINAAPVVFRWKYKMNDFVL